MMDKNEAIEKPGVYRIAHANYELTVLSENGIIEYSMVNNRHEIVIDSRRLDRTVGAHQRWSMGWDEENESLWVLSSDVGLVVWRRDSAGKFESELIRPDTINLLNTMPECLRTRLPQSIQKQL